MMAFSKFNFIKKKFVIKNAKMVIMPKRATKMLILATCCLIFVSKKVVFLTPNQFYWCFLANKKRLRFGFLKLTPVVYSFNIYGTCVCMPYGPDIRQSKV